jgi:hypothetical protein
MSASMRNVLCESVRSLVRAQVGLDGRAADIDRWDREGLPPVALAYTSSRLVLAAPVRALGLAGANGAVALSPAPGRSNGDTGARMAAAVISIGIRLHPHPDNTRTDTENHD